MPGEPASSVAVLDPPATATPPVDAVAGRRARGRRARRRRGRGRGRRARGRRARHRRRRARRAGRSRGCATGSDGRAAPSPATSARCAAARSTTRRGTSSKRRCCSPTSACRRRSGCSTRCAIAPRSRTPPMPTRSSACCAPRSSTSSRTTPDRTLHATPAEANVWMFVGVNGVGKTTTIGKLASQQVADGRRVVLAAADTFRAAAADQLELWAERTGGEIVRGAGGCRSRFRRVRRDGRGARRGRRPRARRHRRAACTRSATSWRR